jgi:hypothetical protein
LNGKLPKFDKYLNSSYLVHYQTIILVFYQRVFLVGLDLVSAEKQNKSSKRLKIASKKIMYCHIKDAIRGLR